MAKTKQSSMAIPMASYNTSLFANKSQVQKIVRPHIDFVPHAYGYQTSLGAALMRQPANKDYN